MELRYKLFNNALAAKGQDWMPVNIIMIQRIGLKEAITIRRYLKAQNYFAEKNQLSYDGYFFSTYDDIATTTGLSRKQVIAAVKTLEETWLFMGDKKKNYHKYYHKHIEEGMKEKEAEKQAEIDCENEFIALVNKLNEDIKSIKEDDHIKEEEKNKKIIQLKKDAGYNRLLDTDISIINKVKRKWFKVNGDVYDEFLKDGNGYICTNTEDEKYWIIYNKNFALKYGPIATIVFSDMYSTFLNAKEDGTLKDEKWFKQTHRKLSQKFGITRQTYSSTYLPMLKDAELIEVCKMGWNNNTHIAINEEKLKEILGLKEVFDALENNNETDVERITRIIIEKAKGYGEDWHYKFYEYATYIEERLAEGITEKELIDIIDYVHDYYCIPKNQKYYKTNFTFKYIYGKGRCKEQWISMKNGEAATKNILFKIQQITNNKFVWDISEKKVNLIRRRLDNGISEQDLINFVENRYNHLSKDPDCKYTNFTFEKLFADENEDQIRAYLNSKTPKANYSNKSYKHQNPEERSGIHLNTNADKRGVLTQAEVARREAEGEEVF